MKLLIIEDEQLGTEKLIRLLTSIDPSIEITGNTRSIKSSVEWLLKNPHPDIILMDIELTDGQSFEIFNHVAIKSMVIFTTSYDEYALQAFKVNSVDYLLKPIKREELKNALEKYQHWKQQFSSSALSIEKLINELKQQQTKTWRSRFLVKKGQELVSVETADIAYFYADGRLSFLLPGPGKSMFLTIPLRNWSRCWTPSNFIALTGHSLCRSKLLHKFTIISTAN